MHKKSVCIFLFLFISLQSLNAQTQQQHTGWFLWLNSTKLNARWGIHLDVQLRTADEWAYLRNVLVRPGITYHLPSGQQLTAGYLYTHASSGPLIGSNSFRLVEHRSWQQFVHPHRLGEAYVSHRFRLEQRFMEQRTGPDAFAQRFRYFIRAVQALKKLDGTPFQEGGFVALQNEVFFNVQNKSATNDHFLDQNRAYLALGYRFSKSLDLEAGYLHQTANGRYAHTVNHAVQLALYTRF